ncbi:MAG: hypothetical protein A2086_16365 [Spirochaetes bacterium GWD1_27_9]|nr:MAG: hypothetical protein A2Y34_18135 [Spirochaetes bacterium GWC1_27_15]OHD35374.1 MAG: hypothetical protein A2086_16365 [Spirochaetes bacterium GWD1_27_9]
MFTDKLPDFTLSKNFLTNSPKHKEKKIDNSQFEEAYKKALNIIKYSPQMEKILSLKLKKNGFDKETIEKVIEKLKEYNFLNDLENSQSYIRNLAGKLYGKNKILAKLFEKGIKKDIAESQLSDFFAENPEEEIANKFIQKNQTTFKDFFENGQIDKFKQKLYNHGFSIETIERVTRAFREE